MAGLTSRNLRSSLSFLLMNTGWIVVLIFKLRSVRRFFTILADTWSLNGMTTRMGAGACRLMEFAGLLPWNLWTVWQPDWIGASGTRGTYSISAVTKRPSSLIARAMTWSNCKHHNTVKFLIGVTPQGVISFISKAWGGRVSDKYLTENSGLLRKLLPGDIVFADGALI